ncbi:MAG: hypothetical protein AAF497_09300 [Planctomycetota bacterium]
MISKLTTTNSRTGCALLTFILMLVCGCGGPTDGRVGISGNVTLDGNPLESGDISLTPLGPGPTTAGRIENGEFKIPAEKGPKPGKYRVSIESFVEEAAKNTGGPDEFQGTSARQILPDKYNSASTLEMDVKEGRNDPFTFNLTSKS